MIGGNRVNIEKIIKELQQNNILSTKQINYEQLNGGTVSELYLLHNNGKKYVVDGHHRLIAAKKLHMQKVPVEKVQLPYKGYRSIEDLFW